jgi:hypothetical protein
VSGITDNNQDRSRQFMENYDLVEGMSIGAHSFIWKVKSRVTSQFFCLKIIKKQKYGDTGGKSCNCSPNTKLS